jgi:hypothetical protein
VLELLGDCSQIWDRFGARKAACPRHILGSATCPKSGAPVPYSGLDFVPEKCAACATFWAGFRDRKVGSLRHILGSISCPKSGHDFVPVFRPAIMTPYMCHISGTKSSPLFGHEIEPRMRRRRSTFRARNRAQNSAQARHFSGTKLNPECGAGAQGFGHELEPRMRRTRAAFRARNPPACLPGVDVTVRARAPRV